MIKLATSPATLAQLLQHSIVRIQYYAGTCNLQPITAYRPVDGISPLNGISRLLTEHVPDDRV